MVAKTGEKRVEAGSDGISSLLSLFNALGGNKVTGTADTSALQNVISQSQALDPNALLQQVFQQAAGQIPGLSGAMSNASGARSGGNAPLQAALQKLLQQTTIAGTDKVLNAQQQNLATQTQAASAIANATRGTQSGNSLGTNAGLLAGLQVLGKTGAMDKLGKLFTGDSADVGSSAADSALNLTASPSIDLSNLNSAVGGSGDLTSSYDFGSGLADFGGSISDTFSGLGDAISSGASELYDSFSGAFGFADGGLVGRDGKQEKPAPAKKGYADGGEVSIKTGGGRSSSAPTFNPDQIQQSLAQNLSQFRSSTPVETRGPGQQGGDLDSTDGNTGVGGTPAQNQSVIGGAGLALLGLLGVPGLAVSALSKAVGVDPLNTQITKALMSQLAGSANPISAGLASSANQVADQAALSGVPTDPLDALMGLTDSFGTSTGGDKGNFGYGYGDNQADTGGPTRNMLGPGGLSTGGVGSSSGGESSSSSGGDAGGGYANGGYLNGKGTGTSDSMTAKVSDGEYIIPADVVEKLGANFFDNLRAQFHTPVGL